MKSVNMKIAAGFVLYNPNLERFLQCLQRARQQFDCVFLFDNVGNQKHLIERFNDVVYFTENTNKGIAYALNKIMKRAKQELYDWVVTLDQDTVIPENLVANYRLYVGLKDIAIISPQVIDKRRLYLTVNETNEEVIDLDFCITSASCTNVKIWESLGGFDEKLFIDFVDNDYCKRIKLSNYRILQLTRLIIDQEFGNITLKSPQKVKFYLWLSKIMHNTNIAKLTYHKEVSPLRIYYVHRNLLYLNKKFQKVGGIGYRNFGCKSFLGFLLCFTLPSILRGQHKIKIVKAVMKGFYDGYKLDISPI